jgi:hypothetical protein
MSWHLQSPRGTNLSDEPALPVAGDELGPCPRYLTVKQFCQLAQVSRSAVYCYVRKNLLLATRLPGGRS